MGIQRTLTPTALFVFLGACASHADQFSAQNPFAASSTVKIAEAQKLSLVFSNNVQGFVGPCGCAYNPKGGLDRRLEFLKTKNYLHNSSAIVVDGGNALFPNLRLDEGQEKVLKEKAQVILQAHQLMGLSVANVGHLDLAAGLDFLRNSAPKDYPFLSTNLRGPRGEKLFDTKKVIERNSRQIVFLGLSEGFFPAVNAPVTALDPVAAVKSELAGVPASSLVIVLSDMGLKKNEDLGRAIGRPLLIIGARDLSSLELPLQFANDLEVRPQIQGQQWGVLDLAWQGGIKGWFSPEVGESFKARWERLAAEEKELAAMPKSEDLKRELASFARVAGDMRAYAPGDLSGRAVYNYRLYDLTTEYAKDNPLSAVVKKYQ